MKITPILVKSYQNKNKIYFAGKAKAITLSCNNSQSINNYLANASYWDVYDDAFDKTNIETRKRNFDCLEQLTDNAKADFIKDYCFATGFPDLKAVSRNIETEFVMACEACETELNHQTTSVNYTIVQAGYDDSCSVGNATALPGSDLDRAYVILQGCDDDETNKKIVNEFSAKLWDYTDQRILSFNHYQTFPIIKTIKQVQDEFKSYDESLTSAQIETYNKEMQAYSSNNFIGINSFLINQSAKIQIKDKMNFLTNAYLAEVLRAGKVLKNNYYSHVFINRIKDTNIFKYSNITQLQAIKKNSNFLENLYKQKRAKRKRLVNEYQQYTNTAKFDTIKSFIAASCELSPKNEELYKNSQDIGFQVGQLLSMLNYNSPNYEVVPQIKDINNGYEISATANEEDKAKLYIADYGNDASRIYAEFSKLPMLVYILNNKALIKSLDKFRNVRFLQFSAPADFAEQGFNKTHNYPDGIFASFISEY